MILSNKPMKRFAPLLFLLAAFSLGLMVGKSSPPAPTQSTGVLRRESVNPKPKEGEYRVARVLDGDTVELTTGERVRYHGIDAPENNERWGTVAYETNRDLVEGKIVRLELDRPTRDQYGRTLGYVWVGETLVNERLVDDGLATVLVIKGEAKPKYLSRLQAAEDRAKGATRGLWAPRP